MGGVAWRVRWMEVSGFVNSQHQKHSLKQRQQNLQSLSSPKVTLVNLNPKDDLGQQPTRVS